MALPVGECLFSCLITRYRHSTTALRLVWCRLLSMVWSSLTDVCSCTLECCLPTFRAVIDFYRATLMHSADYAVQDVCLSVCPSHAGIVSKRLYISSNFFHYRIAPSFQFSHTKRDGSIATGRRMQGGMKKSQFSTNILALSPTWCKIEP